MPALRALALPLQPVLPALTAFPFLGALAVKLANRQRAYDADWFDGRAVAETVKTQTWRYAMRVAPYDGEAADRDFGADTATVRSGPMGNRSRHRTSPTGPDVTLWATLDSGERGTW